MIDTLHLRSHAEGVCKDYHPELEAKKMSLYLSNSGQKRFELYNYSLDILCLMALTEALGLEYGGFVSA